MKRLACISIASLMLISCYPVLRQDLLRTASSNVPFQNIVNEPALYRGKLFVLGGLIVKTKNTEKGSLIEAVYIQSTASGYLQPPDKTHARYLAFYPIENGILDPAVYRQGREITIAGQFIETRKGKIDEMDYVFPVFEIKDIYLWEEYLTSPYGLPYSPYFYQSPYSYPYPYCYDRWDRYYYSPPYFIPPLPRR